MPAATPVRIQQLLRRSLQKDPKRRLRDIGEAQVAIDSPDDQVSLAVPQNGRRRGQVLAGWMAAAAFALLTVTLATSLAASWRNGSPEPLRFHVLPPPGHSFIVWDSPLAVSPDGRRIAFVAAAAASQIWIRSLDAIAAQPIAGTANAHLLFWSPDGRSLGFNAGGTLKRVDLDGSMVRVLISGIPNNSHGTWGSSGTILFTGADDALWQIPDSGGEPAVDDAGQPRSRLRGERRRIAISRGARTGAARRAVRRTRVGAELD